MPIFPLNLANILFISSGIAHNDRSSLNPSQKHKPSIVVTQGNATQDQFK